MSINRMVNEFRLKGNLTKDPETSYTPKGTMKVTFSIAVNMRQKVGDEWQDRTEYFDCTIWGKRAERFRQYAKKGTNVTVLCEVTKNKSEKDGVKVTYWNLDVTDYEINRGGRTKEEAAGFGAAGGYSGADTGEDEEEDSRIPF